MSKVDLGAMSEAMALLVAAHIDCECIVDARGIPYSRNCNRCSVIKKLGHEEYVNSYLEEEEYDESED